MSDSKYRYLLVGVVCLVLGAIGCYWFTKGDHKHLDNNMSNSTSGIVSTTSIQAVPKQSISDPDVIVSQQYVAVVNGEKVSVPVAKTISNSSSKPSSSSGSPVGQTQGIITQTIDLTPVMSKLQPRWELGAGYMYNSNKDKHYGCVSIQRNYKMNKAVELTGFVSTTTGKFDSFMVQHKWLIR